MNKKILYVIGADIDVDLCKSLVPGDQVLMEVNGGRYYTEQKHPFVAEEPWLVVENDWLDDNGLLGQLVLRHSKVPWPMLLNYQTAHIQTGQPIVFKAIREKNHHLSEGPLFIVLQLVAYKQTESKISEEFPYLEKEEILAFQEAMEDPVVRRELLTDWSERLCHSVSKIGWKYNSWKRISIRACIPLYIMNAFLTKDLQLCKNIDNDNLLKLRIECHWLKMLLKQTGYIGHDFEKEFVKPNEKEAL